MELVDLREGVFGDLCGQDFSPVFDALAEEVVLTTPSACSWDVPNPPPDEVLDAEAVEVELVVEGSEETLMRVENELACDGGEGWYFSPSILDPQSVSVCPATCTRIQEANAAEVNISFPCELPPEHED